MITSKQTPRVAEFFAGIGLMRAGLERSGWEVAFANDIDPTKRRQYLYNFKNSENHFHLGDVHQLNAKNVPDIELATASFPCTDLSLAGKRAGLLGKQSSAFWGFINILKNMKERRPPLILLENVAGFLTSNNGEDFQSALLALNKLGYAVDAFIVDAAHFVPQSRVRLFIVGKQHSSGLNDSVDYFEESELRPTKLRDFICDHPEIDWNINFNLPKLPRLNMTLNEIVERIPKSSKEWWSEERVKYLLRQTFERHLNKVLELKKANKYTYLTAFRRVRNAKSMAEIRFDGIAGCLRTPKGGSARQILLEVGKGEINIRLLTPKECAKLMGADNFRISGTVNEALFGFGDAVCVPVVSWISKHYLKRELNPLDKKELQYEKFAQSA